MGPLTPRPDEEPFPDTGAPRGPVRGFSTDPAAGGPGWADWKATTRTMDAEGAEDAMKAHHKDIRGEAKEEAERYKAMSPKERREEFGDDGGSDVLAGERKIAFAYGLGEIAHRLGSISEHQGDLFAASVRRYPQSGSGSGGGQWRPQRGVRERNIG